MKALVAVSAGLSVLTLVAVLAVGWQVLAPRRAGGERPATRAEVERLAAELAEIRAALNRLEHPAVKDPLAGGAPSAASLAPLLRSLDPAVRLSAVGLMKGLRDPAAVPALSEVARSDPDPVVRGAAMEALRTFGPAAAFDVLIASLGHPESEVRRRAAEELGRLGDKRAAAPLVRLFEAEIKRMGPPEPGARATLIPPIVIGLLGALAALDPDQALSCGLRAAAADPFDFKVLDVLKKTVNAGNLPRFLELANELPPAGAAEFFEESTIRMGAHYAALEALRPLRDRRAIPYITKQLSSLNARVRAAAAVALAEAAGREAYPRVLEQLTFEFQSAEKADLPPADGFVVALVEALYSTGDPRACAVLAEWVGKSKHAGIRLWAARGLRYSVDRQVGPTICKLWKDERDPQVKTMLRRVLEQIRGYGYVWDAAAGDFRAVAPDGPPGAAP